MKTILVAIGVILIGFSSCNKCYTCADNKEYCKGDYHYDLAKSGKIVDIQGESIPCSPK